MLLINTLAFARSADNGPPNRMDDKTDVPVFYYDIGTYPMINRDSIEIHIRTKLPFDAIQFLKDGDDFVGVYEISVFILDENDKKTASKIWKQELRTQSFSETNSQELFDINEVRFSVLPGDYSVIVGVMDLDTKKKNIRKETLKLDKFYAKSITISNLNIIEQVVQDDDGKSNDITSIEGKVSDASPIFTVSFDVLSDSGAGEIHYQILTVDGKEVLSKTIDATFADGISTKRIAINRANLGYSKYNMKVTVKIGSESASREKIFQLRWLGMSDLIDDLDTAINQMKYIANAKTTKSFKKASDKEKKKKFIEFWKKRDPSPGTAENELMNEYYRRVRYSNEHFSGVTEGWRTDMGMIFILFGPPSDIERHPFELDSKPYEIWYYNEISKSFVFIDETGFGDYRLSRSSYNDDFLRY
jgi:GWxTD domain-containing protein